MSYLSEHRFLRRQSVLRGLLAAGGVALVLAIYVTAALFAAPSLVERTLAGYAGGAPERSATVERVRVNPFLFELTLTGVQVRDGRVGIEFVAPRVVLNFSALAVLARRPVLDAVLIEQPTFTIETLSALSALRELLAALRVEHLELNDGELRFVDGDAATHRLVLGDATARIEQFDGRPDAPRTTEPARYALSAVADTGATLTLNGTLPAGLTSVSGRLEISRLSLEVLRPWLGARLAGLLARGSLDLAAPFVVTTPLTTPTLEITEGHTEIRDLYFEPVPGIVVRGAHVRGNSTLFVHASGGPAAARARIDVENAGFELADMRVAPPVAFTVAEISGNASVASDSAPTTVDLVGRLVDAGRAELSLGLPVTAAADRTVALNLADVPTAILAPYVAQIFGRTLVDGRADIGVRYFTARGRVEGGARIVTRGLVVDTTGVDQGDDAKPSFELAQALLEDENGTLAMDVPFTGNEATLGVASVVAEALRARVAALVAQPFAALAAVTGTDPQTLRTVPFDPGGAGLTTRALDTLDELARGLRARPGLDLQVLGGFDPNVDREALAKQQIELHVLLATAGPSPQARPAPVDVASPRVQDVLDEFAHERLPPPRLAAIAAAFNCGTTLDEACRTGYYTAVFDALVANESITTATLTRLGRFRAQSTANALAQRGVERDRIEVADGTPSATPETVALPLELRVNRGR